MIVKTFSATKARDREHLGDRVTAWIREQTGIVVNDYRVSQSSDNEFHCLTITLFCGELDMSGMSLKRKSDFRR